MINKDFLFSRQPVVDSKTTTKANALLHQNNGADEPTSFLSLLFTDLSVVDSIKHQPIFVPISIDDIANLPMPAPSLRIILFFDANTLVPDRDSDVLSGLRLDGYQLGLTNFSLTFFGTPFFDFFSYVELDFAKFGLDKTLTISKHQGLIHKEIWISQIASHNDFENLKDQTHAGWFSGRFLAEPIQVKGNRIQGYRLILSNLLVHLQNGRSSIKDIAACIEQDATLAYRVLKLTKSVMYHRQFNVHNVQRAIEIIGIKDLMKWVALAMFGSVDGKPDCLFSMAVNRACFCESIAKAVNPKLEGAFLVGLFSYLPSFFGNSLEEILHDLPLHESMVSALIDYQGELGQVLLLSKYYEAGSWDEVTVETLNTINLSSHHLRKIYMESLATAKEIYQIV